MKYRYAILTLWIFLLGLVEPVFAQKPFLVKSRFPSEDMVVAEWDVTKDPFHADNSGCKDASQAIQAAIDSCYAHKGGTVWIPSGKFSLSRTIEVKDFVTLRGDWCDPDKAKRDYGTTILAMPEPGEGGAVLFKIGYSAAVMGLTIFYPKQHLPDPIPYNYTFYVEGWKMTPSVINCTLLNSYRGIGVNTLNNSTPIEVGTFRNIKGTVLYRGIEAENESDVSTWEHICFDNRYWAAAGKICHAPKRNEIDKFTRDYGIAFTFGDLEWDQFYRLDCSDYKTGMKIAKGSRIAFCGVFAGLNFRNCETGIDAEVLDSRWGMAIFQSYIEGSEFSIRNISNGFIKLSQCRLKGVVQGDIRRTNHTTIGKYHETSCKRISRKVLYDATSVPHTISGTILPTICCAEKLQTILDQAARDGGGLVYLPAGWYLLTAPIRVPANVELHGSSLVPQLDGKDSYGTVFMVDYHLKVTTNHENSVPVTIQGPNAGLTGVRFFYPESNPAGTIEPKPFTIQGRGPGIYLENIGLMGCYDGIDLATYTCSHHLVRKVLGTVYHHGVETGKGRGGNIEGCLTNGAKVCRVGFRIPGWANEKNVFREIIDKVTRQTEELIVIKGTKKEFLLNNFAYGSKTGLSLYDGSAYCLNFGTDNLNKNGSTFFCRNGKLDAINAMRYNGQMSVGQQVNLINPLFIGENPSKIVKKTASN
ncbi:MAG: hypothetical protein LWW85_07145 [Marinilabiliales bacterium]|nr:hypothetical protein [Marinilabiliales bacterium]